MSGDSKTSQSLYGSDFEQVPGIVFSHRNELGILGIGLVTMIIRIAGKYGGRAPLSTRFLKELGVGPDRAIPLRSKILALMPYAFSEGEPGRDGTYVVLFDRDGLARAHRDWVSQQTGRSAPAPAPAPLQPTVNAVPAAKPPPAKPARKKAGGRSDAPEHQQLAAVYNANRGTLPEAMADAQTGLIIVSADLARLMDNKLLSVYGATQAAELVRNATLYAAKEAREKPGQWVDNMASLVNVIRRAEEWAPLYRAPGGTRRTASARRTALTDDYEAPAVI
ncbi:hypothetical protein [Deinococcus arenicola]|uniref:Uncharacterized protein n=1 Tax=Deinococcus arenicola TaxID=2994950 RepID=A0ABU4DVG3_9DEIO|nr:hypothetical protein [Deinococcus sp. ZS9-10]MDV6376427.1 hypothetical protein [Deinococcus sp. ZS9-10]